MILFKLSDDAKEDADIPVIKSDLVTENEGFKWKGHQPLVVKADKFKMPQGFKPASILTISPPASVNSLAFSDDYGILAIGTAHGLIILDTIQSVVALTKCTLNAQGELVLPTLQYCHPQCGNYRIFLSFRFYVKVKSICGILEVQNLSF